MSSPVVKLIGIDFSGANDAGRRIWIAEAALIGEETRIISLQPAEELPDSGRARERCFSALRKRIADPGPSFVGLDFPFGVSEFLFDGEDWFAFVSMVGQRFPDPDAFRNWCSERSREYSGRPEGRRGTDVDQQTPFSPWNLRMYKQTFFGIRDVLAPLVSGDLVRVIPMQTQHPGLPTVIEICPESTLKVNMVLPGPYKVPRGRAERSAIIEWMRGQGILVRRQDRKRAIEDPGGDAVDALLAIVATRNARNDILARPIWTELQRLEGHVFV